MKRNRSKKARRLFYPALFIMLLAQAHRADAQKNLTIDECYTAARNNYPLLKQMQLIARTAAYSLDNASKGMLPQFNVNAQATYQSDVTQVPISLPGMNIPALSKDQYKIYAEVSQPLTDLYTVNHQKELIKANTVVEEQKIEVEMYKLKERINQLFFGILVIDEQIRQTVLLRKDIQTGIDKINAAIANGTALKTNADVLEAEMIKTDQRRIELKAARKAYAGMLSLFINQPVDETVKLEKPLPTATIATINRPELKLYDYQQKTYLVQDKQIEDRKLPRVSVFLQGGYGKPGLNALKNEFDPYYIGGLKLNWNLSALYTYKKDRKQLQVNQQAVEVQKETFLFNTNLSLKQQDGEIGKFNELIATDDQIIRLREKIKNTASNQLENGVITANDYLTYVNAEDQARQNQIIHKVQLLLAQYNYQTTSGN